MATNYEPKVCQECGHQPFLSESGYCENGCTFEPKECALRKARLIKSAKREAQQNGKSLEEVLAEREKAFWYGVSKDDARYVEWLQEECDEQSV